MTETTPEEYRARRKRLADFCRGGGFVQTKGKLHHGSNCYCPLGLACDHYRQETGLGQWEWDEAGWFNFVCPTEGGTGLHRREGTIPPPVRRYYGFWSGEGFYVDSETQETATVIAKADTGKLSIRGFADMLEDPPRGLFRPETL